jgi:hypothetical protein
MPINRSPNNPNSSRSGRGGFRYRSIRAIFRTDGAHYGAVNIVMVGLEEDVAVRFPVAKRSAQRRSSTVHPKMWSPAARQSAAKIIWGWLSNVPAPISLSNNP